MRLGLFICFVAAPFFIGCAESAVSEKTWITFAPPNGNFSVELPKQPTRSVQQAGGMTIESFACQDDANRRFMVMKMNMPLEIDLNDKQDYENTLDTATKGMLLPQTKKLHEKTFLFQNKYPARDLTIAFSARELPNAVSDWRIILLPTGMIQLSLVQDQDRADDKIVKRFFESLAIK